MQMFFSLPDLDALEVLWPMSCRECACDHSKQIQIFDFIFKTVQVISQNSQALEFLENFNWCK